MKTEVGPREREGNLSGISVSGFRKHIGQGQQVAANTVTSSLVWKCSRVSCGVSCEDHSENRMCRDLSRLLTVKQSPLSPFSSLYLCSAWLYQQHELGKQFASRSMVMLAMSAPFQEFKYVLERLAIFVLFLGLPRAIQSLPRNPSS